MLNSFDELLDVIREEISEGIIWYGRCCSKSLEYEDAIWLKMGQLDLPSHWEYKRENSNIVYRKGEVDYD